ncbi:sialidase family protein [Noviherbaspirillum aerium]|uniref:sialidase family protein n=1 Tax=Noviherbaspirillum aerium TaxID=2588497 RepID=UPI00124BED00|nr:sialidase family protein [Noviherbaspirillum aerium]
MNISIRQLACAAGLLSMISLFPSAQAADGHGHGQGHGSHAARPELGADAAFAADGTLWAVTRQADKGDQALALRTSGDGGKTWSAQRRIDNPSEPITARGEARPHIVMGPAGDIYVSYTSTVAPPHIGDIRFIRSQDGGKTFSRPMTVHANRDRITHSFESMAVDHAGRIYIAWIDGRGAAEAKEKQRRYAGSAVYYAVSEDRGASFKGDYRVADNACECCRIGIALDQQGKPVVMWRHVFAPNARDHALSELAPDGKAGALKRVTQDDWRIDACPHHGPSLAFGDDGRRHQVWFNGKEQGGGAFYGSVPGDGTIKRPLRLGSEQASHPDVAAAGKHVAVAWKQFDGKATSIIARLSADGGASWSERELARTSGASDQPHLVSDGKRISLIWNTQDQGLLGFPLAATGK